MQLGDKVFIVPNPVPGRGTPPQGYFTVEFNGSDHFMAGDYTFSRVHETSRPLIGTHPRARAYASKEDFDYEMKKRAVWRRLHAIITRKDLPPTNVPLENIERAYELINGK